MSKKLSRICYKNYIMKFQNDCCNNPKAFFSFIKGDSKDSSFPSSITYDNYTAFNLQEVVDLFARFFGSVFCDNDYLYNDRNFKNLVAHPIFDLTDDDILKSALSLKSYGSPGPDGVPPIFLRNCIYSLLEPLKLIFQKSLSTFIFPDCWKESFVTPVFKNGDKNLVTNYRPISILCPFSKILESVFHAKLYDRVSNLICQNQHVLLRVYLLLQIFPFMLT